MPPAPKGVIARHAKLQQLKTPLPLAPEVGAARLARVKTARGKSLKAEIDGETAATVRQAIVNRPLSGHGLSHSWSRLQAAARQDQESRASQARVFEQNRREEKGIVALWLEQGDEIARNELVLRHRPLVKRLAIQVWRANGRLLSLDDLRQIGMVALLEAAETYDPANPTEAGFATYAQASVASAMTRGIMNDAGPTRVCTNIHDKRVWYRFRQLARRIEQREGRALNEAEIEAIAAEIDVPASAIHRMLPRLSRADRSLDETETTRMNSPGEIDREPRWTYGEGVVAASDPEAEAAASREPETHGKAVDIALGALDDHERSILLMRWLPPSGKKVSLAQVGLAIHRSKRTVNDLEHKAFAKMRQALETAGYTSEALGPIENGFIPYGRAPLVARQ